MLGEFEFGIGGNCRYGHLNIFDVSTKFWIFQFSKSAKKVFLTAELDDITRFFNENISLDPCNYYVPQIFYYFKTDKLISKFQYVHGNDLNMYTNRGSNVSLYGESLCF